MRNETKGGASPLGETATECRPLHSATRERLTFERAPVVESTTDVFDAALEAIVAPAFYVDASGAVLRANAAGTILARRPHIRSRLRDTLCADGPRDGLDLYPIPSDSTPPVRWIIVDRSPAAECDARVAASARRLGLTERQRQVLALIAEGMSVRAMASTLGCSKKTVEAHITVLLDRAQVESRAELTAQLWMRG